MCIFFNDSILYCLINLQTWLQCLRKIQARLSLRSMLNDSTIKTPAEQQKLTVSPPAASALQSLQNIVVTTLWSNWALFEVLEKEIQLQRLLRQQSLFPRPPSTPYGKLQDSCNTTTTTVEPCCSSVATFAVPVNESNQNSDN